MTCKGCGAELLEGRRLPWCSVCWGAKFNKLPIPLKQMTPDQRREYKRVIQKRKRRKAKARGKRYETYYRGSCGHRVSDPTNKRCLACWKKHLREAAIARLPEKAQLLRRYAREYMRGYRARTPEQRSAARRERDMALLARRPTERKPCKFTGCQFYGLPHAHCECGMEVRLDQAACQLCIAEQARLEFKVWEEAA